MSAAKYPKEFRTSGVRNKLFITWLNMLDRCRPEYTNSRRYFDRGIGLTTMLWTYWPNFCQWAESNGWRPGLEIDRRDNDKGYGPENCRFVTNLEQSRNRDQENLRKSMRAACTAYHAKPFVCVETGQVFQTEMEGSRVMGIERRSIGRCLKGVYLKAGGFHFKYMSRNSSTGGSALTAQAS